MDRMVTERVKALERERTEIRRRQEQVIMLLTRVGELSWRMKEFPMSTLDIDLLNASMTGTRMLAALINHGATLSQRIDSLRCGSFRANCDNWNQPRSAYDE